MNLRTSRNLAVLALSLGAFICSAAPARATIEIAYTIDGSGAPNVLAVSPGTLVGYTGFIGGLFNVAITLGTTNTPGTPSLSFTTQGTQVLQTLYSTGSHTLNLYVSADGFNSPSGATNLLNTSGISQLYGGTTNVTFTSFATAGSSLLSTAGPSTSASYSITGSADSFGNNSAAPITLSAPYTLTNRGDYSLAANTYVTIVGGSTSVTPRAVPEPATLMSALAAIPIFGLGYWRNRRRKLA